MTKKLIDEDLSLCFACNTWMNEAGTRFLTSLVPGLLHICRDPFIFYANPLPGFM